MKILAIEKEFENTLPEAFLPYLEAEAWQVWKLHTEGVIREAYFRADLSSAVLMLEADSVDDAREILSSLPLVEAGLIYFEFVPLVPYPGYERLFKKDLKTDQRPGSC
jgi:hypothetical protein